MNLGDKIKHAGKTYECYCIYPNSNGSLMADFKEVQENAYRNAAGPHQEGDVYREGGYIKIAQGNVAHALAATVSTSTDKILLVRDGKPWK